MQPGDLLVGDAVGGVQVVEPGPAHRLDLHPHVGAVQQQPVSADFVRAVGPDGDGGADPADQYMTVVAGAGAGGPGDRDVQ